MAYGSVKVDSIVTSTKEVVVDNLTVSGQIVDADINASAAIAGSKIQAASTSNAGAVQLTDSTSSTSTTTAATPNAVKSAYDLANAALPKAGGTLTGDVTLNAQSDLRFADADSSNWVALQAPATVASNVTWTLPNADGTSGQALVTNGSGTLSWAAASGGASVTTSDTAPSTPSDGDLWYDSVGGRTYVYYDDGNTSQWVDAAPQGGGSGTSITTGNTTAEVVDTGSDGRFVVTTEGSERARIDSSGRLLVGTSTARTDIGSNQTAAVQTESTVNGLGFFSAYNQNNAFGTALALAKSRGTTVGSNTIVQSGDQIGGVLFYGADGVDTALAGSIECYVDGTPGANDMPGRLVFSTTADGASSPTERLRITSSGDIGVNFTGTPLAKIDVRQTANSAGLFVYKSDTGTTAALSVRHDGATGATSRTQIEFAGNATGKIGSITSTGTATAYNTSSDYRLKENVTAVTGAIARLRELKPSRFNFIADPGTTVDGFIAHEVQEVVPEAITGEKDAVDDDGNPIYQGIDQSKLVPLLTAALQEAVARIEQLETAVASLQGS